MTRSSRSSWISPALASFLACLALLVPAAPSSAQQRSSAGQSQNPEVTVTANLRSPELFVGDSQLFQINVRGSRDVQPPILPDIPNATSLYHGPQNYSSSSTIIINGVIRSESTTEFAFVYEVRPNAVGSYTIPAIEVLVAGRTYTTTPVSFTVREVPKSADITLEVSTDVKEAYVGQPVPIRLTWTRARSIERHVFRLPELPLATIENGPDPVPPGTYPNDQRYERWSFGNSACNATVSRSAIDSRPVDIATADLVLIPKAPGQLVLPPIRVDFLAVVGTRRPNAMDFPFGSTNVTERQTASTKPLALNVKELPTAGRPSNFSGLIGNFALSAATSANTASVGEPIDLRVAVTGTHPLTRVPPLDLTTQPIARDFRVPRDPVLPEESRSRVTFQTPIRARRDGSLTIPPIEINYFDPSSGSYKTAASLPISVKVTPSTTVSLPEDTATSASSSSSPGSPSAATGASTPVVPTLLPPMLASDPLLRTSWRSSWPFAALLAFPVLLAVSVRLFRIHAQRQSPARIRRLALRAFSKEVTAATADQPSVAADRLARAARGYVASTLADRRELTSHEAAQALAHAGMAGDAASFNDALRTLDEARFAPHAPAPESRSIASRLRDSVTLLHRRMARRTT